MLTMLRRWTQFNYRYGSERMRWTVAGRSRLGTRHFRPRHGPLGSCGRNWKVDTNRDVGLVASFGAILWLMEFLVQESFNAKMLAFYSEIPGHELAPVGWTEDCDSHETI